MGKVDRYLGSKKVTKTNLVNVNISIFDIFFNNINKFNLGIKRIFAHSD